MRIRFVVVILVLAFLALQIVEQKAQAKPHKVHMIKHRSMRDIGYEISDALSVLNNTRETIGMPALQENKTLANAAQAHADYLVTNHISSHHENKSHKGYTGKRPINRALNAGYRARFVGENLSTRSRDALDSLKGLFSAIYHRFGFLDPLFDEVGIGIAQDKTDPDNSAFVYLMGNSEIEHLCHKRSFRGRGNYMTRACKNTKHRIGARAYRRAKSIVRSLSPRIILYPYDGQSEVPPAFYDETPDPLPDYDVSGFPVSIEFNDPRSKSIRLKSFRLFEKNGDEVKSVRLLDKRSDPQGKLSRYQFALLPLERLKYDTEYIAKVKYTQKGKTDTLEWSFSTIRPPVELVVIRKKHDEITLKAGKSYWLYFEPHDPRDVMKAMQFPADMYIRFVDNNTMRVVIAPERSRDFEIKGGDRKLYVKVE